LLIFANFIINFKAYFIYLLLVTVQLTEKTWFSLQFATSSSAAHTIPCEAKTLGNQVIIFWRFYYFFLELDQRDALSVVPTYNGRNVLERACANDDVITQVTSAIEDKYIPIKQLTFQSAAAHRPTSLGRAGKKTATLGTG
jgi:hypothetical protein